MIVDLTPFDGEDAMYSHGAVTGCGGFKEVRDGFNVRSVSLAAGTMSEVQLDPHVSKEADLDESDELEAYSCERVETCGTTCWSRVFATWSFHA